MGVKSLTLSHGCNCHAQGLGHGKWAVVIICRPSKRRSYHGLCGPGLIPSQASKLPYSSCWHHLAPSFPQSYLELVCSQECHTFLIFWEAWTIPKVVGGAPCLEISTGCEEIRTPEPNPLPGPFTSPSNKPICCETACTFLGSFSFLVPKPMCLLGAAASQLKLPLGEVGQHFKLKVRSLVLNPSAC